MVAPVSPAPADWPRQQQQARYLQTLRPMTLFRGSNDAELIPLLDALAEQTFRPRELLMLAGDEPNFTVDPDAPAFYIIASGEVEVLGDTDDEKPLLRLSAGDHFGETAVLHPGRKRPATLRAIGEVKTLVLSAYNFGVMLARYPLVKDALTHSLESQKFYRQYQFNWLGTNEFLALVTRRHWSVLLSREIVPAFLMLCVGGLAWAVGALLGNWLWLWAILGAGGIPLGLWAAWIRLDWGNDYFIITSQRIVYLEKIYLLYDSRQEAPLSSIRSVTVNAPDYLARSLEMGDVIVGTFSGPIVFQAVPYPAAIADLVREQWDRSKARTHQMQLKEIEATLQNRVLHPVSPTLPPLPTVPPKPDGPPVAPLFKVRFEADGKVTYRKHWFVLVEGIWRPSALMLLMVGVASLKVAGVFPAEWSWAAVLLGLTAALVPLALWWAYEFVDWQNDIYEVTAEKIFDIHRKPLGAESKKEAPLDNVLSLRYERPGVLGVILNYGTVIAKVGTEDFRFEGVFDPVGVQNDVYRRLEARLAQKEKKVADQRRAEFLDWFGAYHQAVQPPGAPASTMPSPPVVKAPPIFRVSPTSRTLPPE